MSVLRSTGVTLLLCGIGETWGAEPETLLGLTALALERHPEIAAFDLDAEAARARTTAAGRPMDLQWMFGAEALGAMPDAVDPTMFMVGFEQMFALPPAYRAPRERSALDVRWAAAEQTRVEADVKLALWESAARLRASTAQLDALEQQISAAQAALAFGRARYASGGGSPSPGSGRGGGEPAPEAAPLPNVRAPGSGGGMSGMGGMGGMGGKSAMSASPGAMAMPEMAEMGGMPTGSMAPMGGQGLAALLRLDAEVARIQADREALLARRAGEEARLGLIVGEGAARAVAADPGRFLGTAGASSAQPERVLAATAVQMAEGDVQVARAGQLPTFMLATGVRVMPDGMVEGVDAAVGVTVPIWGGARAQVQAATASAAAEAKRADWVDRGLADAIAATRAEESAAAARAKALSETALPRARAAWEATAAVWAAGGATAGDLVAAWQTEVEITRDAADAELAAELARARLARLEGR